MGWVGGVRGRFWGVRGRFWGARRRPGYRCARSIENFSRIRNVVARASGMDLASSLRRNTFWTLGVRPVGGPGSGVRARRGARAAPGRGARAVPGRGVRAAPVRRNKRHVWGAQKLNPRRVFCYQNVVTVTSDHPLNSDKFSLGLGNNKFTPS